MDDVQQFLSELFLSFEKWEGNKFISDERILEDILCECEESLESWLHLLLPFFNHEVATVTILGD